MASSLLPGRYHLPTHLNVPDSLNFSVAGFSVRVTMRQGVILLFGWSLSFRLWQQSAALGDQGAAGMALRLLLSGSLLLGCVLLATVRIEGRYTEEWLSLWWAYRSQPQIYLWQPLRRTSQTVASDERRGKTEDDPYSAAKLAYYINPRSERAAAPDAHDGAP